MTDQQPKKRRGCFFYGCLTVIVLMLLLGVGVILGIRYVKNLVNTYTDGSPMAMPKVQLADAEREKLKERLREFRDAIDAGKQTPPLILTGEEINALIANDPTMIALKDRFYVSIDNDQLKGQVSIPLGELGVPLCKGRYLNGAGAFKVSLANGELAVTAQSITVKGKLVPERIMADLRKNNLAEGFSSEPKNAELIGKFDSVQVTNGVIQIIVKEKQ